MNDDILRRIRKCFQLNKSANSNESAAALEKAHQLMTKYGLSQNDIDMSYVKESTASIGQRVNPPAYLNYLAHMVGEVFMCEVYYSRIGWRKSNLIFVGVSPSSEIAQYAYSVLQRKLNEARKLHLSTVSKRFKRSNRIAKGDQYCEGWVIAVSDNLEKLLPSTESPSIVKRYMEHKNLPNKKLREARDTTRKGEVNVDLMIGHADGLNVEVNHGVGTNERKQSLLA